MATLVEFGHDISGTTSQRPTNVEAGQRFFDTTLGRELVYNGSAWVTKDGAAPVASGVGAAGTSVTASEQGTGPVKQTVLTVSSLSITMTDAGANGCHGSHKVYDFPAGNIAIIGATCDLTTLAGSGGIADGAALIGAVGTVANTAANETLTSTEADIIPSTDGTLTAGAGTLKGKSTTSQIAVFDGTSTAKDAYLNIAVPNADSSADDTVAVSGTITITWVNCGDN